MLSLWGHSVGPRAIASPSHRRMRARAIAGAGVVSREHAYSRAARLLLCCDSRTRAIGVIRAVSPARADVPPRHARHGFALRGRGGANIRGSLLSGLHPRPAHSVATCRGSYRGDCGRGSRVVCAAWPPRPGSEAPFSIPLQTAVGQWPYCAQRAPDATIVRS